MSNPAEERNYVRRLRVVCGAPWSDIQSLDPPRPDVLMIEPDGSRELIEVTEIHPDEVPALGSAARAAEGQRARRDPASMTAVWIPTEYRPAFRYRVEEKARSALGYDVEVGETLSLLLVASVPKVGAIGSTYVIAQLVCVEHLNAETHAVLSRSRFQHAYLHLPLSGNAVFEWSRARRWRVRRPPDNDCDPDTRRILDQIRTQGGPDRNGLLPGTQIVGRWP